jgi:zinc and cadmium transporter
MSYKNLCKILNYFVSFAAGALIGDVFIHIIPELVEKGFTQIVSIYILSGILLTFIIEKTIHIDHVNKPEAARKYKPYSITSLYGDSIHNFVDGMMIGASYLVNFHLGLATTAAVFLHEIPTEIGHFGVLIKGGFTRNKALFVNFLSALTAVVGAIISLIVGSGIEEIKIFLIAFTAGHFIYIAGADLIPELHKEVELKKSIVQFIFLIIGILIMYSLIFIE